MTMEIKQTKRIYEFNFNVNGNNFGFSIPATSEPEACGLLRQSLVLVIADLDTREITPVSRGQA